ncbi:MAG: glycerophosphodiester phosphodiesterase [Lachnospira sp.]|nr:glycerophosphodiester phosphodiesterase [Lachnospira sp.]
MTIFIIIITTLILLIGLYFFMIAPRMLRKPEINRFYGYHYAHRGLFDNDSSAPENSIHAFQLAIDNGYGIELDVQLTKDNIPVVFHDSTLKRMCNTKGHVHDYTLKELKELTLGISNQRIPTLKEALKTIKGATPVIIEFKPYNMPAKLCNSVWSVLSTYKGPYCMESFHPLMVRWFKKHQPGIVRGQLCMEYWKEPDYKGQVLYILLSFLITNFLTRPDFISYKHEHYNNISRKLCRKMGATAFAWTIRSVKEKEDAEPHFDLFIFDSCKL